MYKRNVWDFDYFESDIEYGFVRDFKGRCFKIFCVAINKNLLVQLKLNNIVYFQRVGYFFDLVDKIDELFKEAVGLYILQKAWGIGNFSGD